MPTQVPGLEDDINISPIGVELNQCVQSISSRINIEDLGDWCCLISVLLRPTDGVGVFK